MVGLFYAFASLAILPPIESTRASRPETVFREKHMRTTGRLVRYPRLLPIRHYHQNR